MRKLFTPLILSVITLNSYAQHADSLTAKDYAHAESFLRYGTQPYIDNGEVNPNWLPGDKFWYKNLNPKGSEIIVVDAAKGTISPSDGTQKAPAIAGRRGFNEKELVSPDSSKLAFIKDYNLWVKDIKTGNLSQLTTDGVKYFGYATDNAGWKKTDNPILKWSPDSKKIATFKQDERLAGDMYLVTTNVGHPKLQSWKYPLPGDSNIITIQRVVIDVDQPKVIFIKSAPDPHRASLSDDISSSGTYDDVQWSPDASEVAFVSTSRNHQQEKFRIADASTGEIREVFEETVPTQYESGQGTINWRYLPNSKEIIWYSERDNWGHLYLYDATTGKVKNQITKGDWVVTQLVKVDEKKRVLYFFADGREPGNPYFT